jgi:hypothetical protein
MSVLYLKAVWVTGTADPGGPQGWRRSKLSTRLRAGSLPCAQQSPHVRLSMLPRISKSPSPVPIVGPPKKTVRTAGTPRIKRLVGLGDGFRYLFWPVQGVRCDAAP